MTICKSLCFVGLTFHLICCHRTVNAELMERDENELLDTADDVKGFLKSPKYHRDIPKYIERTNVVRGRVTEATQYSYINFKEDPKTLSHITSPYFSISRFPITKFTFTCLVYVYKIVCAPEVAFTYAGKQFL